MAKAFIELKQSTRRYKLNAADISKVYKITKRTVPCLPAFAKAVKNIPETDDDTVVDLDV